MGEISFNVNNDMELVAVQSKHDGTVILNDGTLIPAGDMVMLFNLYRDVKEYDLYNVYINPTGKYDDELAHLVKEEKDRSDIKDKEYYRSEYYKQWGRSMAEARIKYHEEGYDEDTLAVLGTEIFEDTVNAEGVVGFYLVLHGYDALGSWKKNTAGVELSDQDKEVNRILEKLFV